VARSAKRPSSFTSHSPACRRRSANWETELGIEIFSRSARGITLSTDGAEFLSYARQVVEQAELLEQRYLDRVPSRRLGSISTQHYAFSVNAFVNLVQRSDVDEYEFTLRETRTYEIIEDVKSLRSEIGVIYLNAFNEKVMGKLLKENHLEFHPLFIARPHVFISASHPLADRNTVSLQDLEEFPYLSFEQGAFNSFYFAEEILSTVYHKKKHPGPVPGPTLFNLLIGLNGYTISTGVLSSDLNGSTIKAIPLESEETLTIGWIMNSKTALSSFGQRYVEELKRLISTI